MTCTIDIYKELTMYNFSLFIIEYNMNVESGLADTLCTQSCNIIYAA